MRKSFLLWIAAIAAALFLGKFVFAGSPASRGGSGPPMATAIVPNGTHFLVRLDDELRTSKDSVNKKFEAKTLEPLETSSGYILPSGAKVRGHISRIDPGGLTVGARLWLTFDDIDTNTGRLPIVAEVSSVPGDFSVKPGESKEGEIEARASNSTRELEAAATGAAIGAATAAAHGGKAAAMGALAGGAAAFVASSGIAQELDLPKGTKLDLVLDRPLYLSQ